MSVAPEPPASSVAPESPASHRKTARKAAFAASIGTVVEAYDFQIYGAASALVFAKVFFTSVPSSWATAFSFATLTIGFLARPIGGLVFGYLGDRLGRKTLLVIALMGAGGCTMLVGALPSQASAGIWAPVLLVLLRLLQGVFHGGEQGGAVLMAVEHAPAHRKNWYGSWALVGTPAGALLAAGALSATIAMTGKAFHTWGWRIPFLASFVLFGIGMVIRSRVAETPAFEKLKQSGGRSRAPLTDVVKHSWRLVLAAIGVNFGFNALALVLLTYSLAYGTEYLHLNNQVMLSATLLGSAAMVVATLAFARLSDAVGRMRVMLAGAVFIAAYPTPLFAFMHTAQPTVVQAAIIVGFIGSSAMYGPMAGFLGELFPTSVAYSGVSIGYSIGAVLGGGLSPLVSSILLRANHGAYLSVSLYLTLAGLVSVVALRYLRRRSASSMTAASPVQVTQ